MYEDFYIKLLTQNKVCTDALVLDELIHLSHKKYSVPYKVTLGFIDTIIKPYATILSIGEEEFNQASRIMKDYGLKPSDAIHVGVMKTNGIELIVSEDKDFDKIEGVKRTWIPVST